MNKPEEYGIFVRLIQDGDEFVYQAKVVELPDVKVYGDTYAEAYEGAIEVIATTQEIFAEKGKRFPTPEIAEEVDFSGRVTLRMSKSLHACVHQRAEKDAVSLNQWIVEAIASRVDGKAIAANSVALITPVQNPATGTVAFSVERPEHIGRLGSVNYFISWTHANVANPAIKHSQLIAYQAPQGISLND